jgi:hypothetical protein
VVRCRSSPKLHRSGGGVSRHGGYLYTTTVIGRQDTTEPGTQPGPRTAAEAAAPRATLSRTAQLMPDGVVPAFDHRFTVCEMDGRRAAGIAVTRPVPDGSREGASG